MGRDVTRHHLMRHHVASHDTENGSMSSETAPAATKRPFKLVLIKPSHYDDQGYVIRWWRAMIPSNSLAAEYGIAADCAKRQVLGEDVAIDIEALDETNTRINIPELISRFRLHNGFGCVAPVGVQSNQYLRALD